MLKLIGKFKHLGDDDVNILQQQSDKRLRVLKALCGMSESAA
jgi:hypothetical protein